MNKDQFVFEEITFQFNPIPGQSYDFLFEEWDRSGNELALRFKELSVCSGRAELLLQHNSTASVAKNLLINGSYPPGEVPISFVDFSKPISAKFTGGTKGVLAFFEYEVFTDPATWNPIGRIVIDDPGNPDIDEFSFQPESGKKYFALGAGIAMQSTITATMAFFLNPSFLQNFPECNFNGFGEDQPIGFVQNEDPEHRENMWQINKNSLTILANNSFPVNSLYFRGKQ